MVTTALKAGKKTIAVRRGGKKDHPQVVQKSWGSPSSHLSEKHIGFSAA